MIWTVMYFIAGCLVFLLIFVKKPKIEIPESKEFEQIEREIKEWLESPITPIKKEIKRMTTSLDTDTGEYLFKEPRIVSPVPAFEGTTREMYTASEVM